MSAIGNMFGGGGGSFGTQTAAGGWQPSPNPTPQAPIGTPGGNALLDWIGAGNMPSIPNPNTLAQFFSGGGGSGYGGGNRNAGGPTPGYQGGPLPPQGFVPSPQQPFPTMGGITSGGSGASAPTANAQAPLSPVSTPQGMGKPAPTLPNPDIGNFGTGGNAPQHGIGDNASMRGPLGDPRFMAMMGHGIPMPRIGAGLGGK